MKDTIEVEEPKMGVLTEDMIEEILNRLPIRPLIRLKCLSKSWCRLISEYRQRSARSSTSTLLCQYNINYMDKESQVIFLNSKEKGAGETQHHYLDSLSFSIKSDLNFWGFSHGLLLCNIHECPYVCNPTLNQCFSLPPISEYNVKKIVLGLAFDGSSPNYNVVQLDVGKVKKNARILKFENFSSVTGKWRKQGARCFNSSLIDFNDQLYVVVNETTYFYRKGMIHWVFYGLMLVYHSQKDFFKLIELPMNMGRLWEAEGYLYYADNYKGRRFLIYEYDDLNLDVEDNDNDGIDKWMLKHVIEFETLKLQLPDLFGPVYEKIVDDVFFNILGFDEDLQILYVTLPGMIGSYSFETQRLRKVWTFDEIDGNDKKSRGSMLVCASFSVRLSGVNVPFGGKLLYPERISQGNEGRPCLLLK